MYYFYRLFEIDENMQRQLITDDVICCDTREDAKKHIIELHGNYPFRKPKYSNHKDKYYYLAESNSYWYKYHHEQYEYRCDVCGKEVIIHGEKNLYPLKNKYGQYCSEHCKKIHTQKMLEIKKQECPWINENDHILVKDKDKNLVGYIYRITNKHSLKSYIGKTIKPPLFRWWQHLKSDCKFERDNISDLVFEVLEIVTYDKNIESSLYKSGEEKLARREMFYITHFDTKDHGFNVMIEKSKIINDYQLELNLQI